MFLADQLAAASPDVLRSMLSTFIQLLIDADVEAICDAGYGEGSEDRVNSRNGYRHREQDTRTGTVDVAIPKLRAGSYFPSFLEHRRRAERALASVVATSYLLGVSTRRVEKLAASLGVVGLSKSQVTAMASDLDEKVEAFGVPPAGPGLTRSCGGALTQKVREGGRAVRVHALARHRRQRRGVPGDHGPGRDHRRGRGGLAGVLPGLAGPSCVSCSPMTCGWTS